MANTVDLRTYVALEKAFVRRLQRSWQKQSAPTYAAIAQACNDHKWDEARRLVLDLDMAEVGTENREWITYMLLSCGVFGASIISKRKPSFVGVGSFDTFLKQTTTNILQYLEYRGTAQVHAEALQSIAEDEAKYKASQLKVAFDPAQPRDEKGRWATTRSAEFKSWFGDWQDPYAFSSRRDPNKMAVSQGVESYGEPQGKAGVRPVRPQVFYHGTLNDVESFEVGRPGFNSNVFGSYETTRHALFFAETPAHAQAFTSQGGKTTGANVVPVFLKMQAPLDFTNGVSDDTLDELAATGEISRGWLRENAGKWSAFDDDAGAMFTKALAKAGYDSVIFWDENPDTRESVKTVAILTPEQVKSAIGNTRFDPKDRRITKWDEAKHPRDKEGQFASTDTRQPGEDPDDMEGAGPERKKWRDLNAQEIKATDAFIDAKEVHRKVIEELEKKHGSIGAMFEEFERVGTDIKYHTSKAALQAAEQAMAKAELDLKAQTPIMKMEVVNNLAVEEAKKLGVHPWYINVVDKEPHEFVVGEKKFTEGGHYQPWDNQIEVNVRNLSYGDAPGVRGLVDHELSHFVYHQMKDAAEKEFQQYLDKAIGPDDNHTPWYHERFEQTDPNLLSSRRIKVKYQEQMAKEFPAHAVLSLLSGGHAHMFEGLSNEMIKENGHSAYAKSYWTPEAISAKHSYEPAINETVAEVTRYLNQPNSWREDPPPVNSTWVQLTKEMHQWYRDHQAKLRRDRIGDALAGKP